MLCEIYERHFFEITVDDSFLKCLNMALELPQSEETLQLFERMFRLTFFRFMKDQDRGKINEWFYKFSELSPEDARRIYKQASHEADYDVSVFDFLRKLDPPLFCEDKIEYMLEKARSEPNVTERAVLFLYTADYVLLNGKKSQTIGDEIVILSFGPDYKVICNCFTEMKEALKYEYGIDERIFEILDEGIGLVKEIYSPEDESCEIFDKINALIFELKSFGILKPNSEKGIGFR